MVTPTTSQKLAGAPRAEADRLMRWSFSMLLVFAFAYLVAAAVGFWLLGALGLNDGDLLLMDHSAIGWIAEIGLTLVLATPPVIGVVLGVRAIRAGAGKLALVAVAINGLLALMALVTFVGNIVITYVQT